MTLEDKLIPLLKKYSDESEVDSPDYILTTYLLGCIEVLHKYNSGCLRLKKKRSINAQN